ncbi:MAG: hypothetical protein P1U89_03935 [Verrucomicrobiales bacterium]|nr:hypothetical protein [Verrucomicrobiales bacterium]
MSLEAVYQTRIDQFAAQEAELTAQSDKLSNYRLGTFLISLAFGIVASVGISHPGLMAFLYLLSAISFAGFIYLVIKHRKITKEEARFRLLKELNEHAIHRLNRNWSEFPVPEAPRELCKLSQAQDLDLFGPASLFQLLSTQRTPQGRTTLAEWLIHRSTSKEISLRQTSAKALSEHIDWRQNLAVIGENLAVDKAVIIPQWLVKKSWFSKEEKVSNYLKFAPWLTLLSAVPTVLFAPLPFIFIPLGIHVYLIKKRRNQIDESLKDLAEEDRKIRSYAEVFEYAQSCPVTKGEVKLLLPKIDEAREAMESLNAIATSAAARGSVVHPFLNAFSCFDLRIVKRLEEWQATYQKKFPTWFEALGEIEALASLSSLYHDEPDWARPELKKSGKFEASALGHPLIKAKSRVPNDVSVGPGGRFLLVTGSNMAGKSTLLRSIGLNTTLAQAGGPVCANSLETPPLTIATSMGVQDSLVDGVSFFMAELQRIKQIVNLTIEEHQAGRTVLFLLDEILQGTNTVERREIVQRVIAHLVKNQAMGAVTTHDLALAESEELTKNADLIHFREHFERDSKGKPKMTFDYKIRDGVATTTNALKILEVIEMPV